MMKRFKIFFIVMVMSFVCLFSVNSLKADVVESSSDYIAISASANLNSLLSYDFEGSKTINDSYNQFGSSIDSSTFNTQNYTYEDYYNVDLSFINYDYYKNFPKYLSNFYLNVNGTVNESSTFNVNLKCDVVFNEVAMLYTSYVDTNNQTINSSFPKSVHIVTESFMAVDNYQYDMNCYFDIWLCYGYKGGGMEYLGSRIFMITSSQTSSTLNELHFSLFNDLTNFNTYLDTISSTYDEVPDVCVPDFNASLLDEYVVYSDDNIVLDASNLLQSDFISTNYIKPSIIHNLIESGNGEEVGSKIVFPLKTISSSSGYIFELQNGRHPIKCLFELYGVGGTVIYSRVVDFTDSYFKFDSSELGPGIIIDAIGISFSPTELENSQYFTLKIVNSAIISAEQSGYNKGYNTGLVKGQSEGFDSGYNAGFINGKNEGLESQFNLGSTLLKIADIPINILSALLSFDILGINVFGLFTGIITILVFIWVIKKFVV